MLQPLQSLRLFGLASLVFASAALSLSGCTKKEDESAPAVQLAGTPGNPRFNLQFTNETSVDLDLYVKTPNGTTIYYGRKSAQGGVLDVDCLCGSCPNGANENIYWVPGSAPSGTYQFWVEYYGRCSGAASSATSNFTLRVVNNNTVVSTYTGTLSSTSPKSTVYSKTY